MTNFKAIIDLFGLSTEEAATYLNVDEPAVVRWCSTTESPPIEVWQALVKLFDTIRFAAEDAAKAADLDHLNASDLNTVHVPLAGDVLGPEGPRRIMTAMAVTTLARVFI